MGIITNNGGELSDGSYVCLLVRGQRGDELSEGHEEVGDGCDSIVLALSYFNFYIASLVCRLATLTHNNQFNIILIARTNTYVVIEQHIYN